jgi:formate dehydrogenase maturation protein FdhE
MKCASYQGFAIGLQAGHCREEAARFRQLAQREPLAQLRRFLTRLAGQYDELATAQALQRPLGNSRAPDKHEA